MNGGVGPAGGVDPADRGGAESRGGAAVGGAAVGGGAAESGGGADSRVGPSAGSGTGFAAGWDEAAEAGLPAVTDAQMLDGLADSQVYALVLLRPGPVPQPPDRDAIIWEHGRRNFALRAAGLMPLVGPIATENPRGLCVLACDVDRARAIIGADPAVRAGILTAEVLPWRSFPGSTLPPVIGSAG